MTIWCDCCKSHLSFPCSLHQCSVDISRGACKRSRSTKGASKVRRDQLNDEIRNMRALLPLRREEQERLSYLHSMAAVCTYIRKSVVLQGVPVGQGPGPSPPYETFLPALHGFILVLSAQGKLVYVSENVAEYLGHSMVDVLQGDTIYGMIEGSDVNTVKAQLESDNCSSTERSFVCCMQTTKAFRLKHGHCCSMLVRGRFRSASRSPSRDFVSTESTSRGERVFVALCTPTVDRLQGSETGPPNPCFSSVHKPDLRFASVSDSVCYSLGYTAEEMSGRSWYGGLHPEDLQRAADAHQRLVEANEGCEVEMVLRLQHKDLSWTWIYTRAANHCDSQSIHCTNYTIGESEALYLVKKVHCSAFGRSLAEADRCPLQAVDVPRPQSRRRCRPAQGFERQRSSDSRGEEPAAKTRRAEGWGAEQDVHRVACVSSSCAGADASPVTMGDSLLLFTPPYSPAPSGSSPQNEELGGDFLLDLHGYPDPSASSPESSPCYYPYLHGGPFTHPSPFRSLRAASPGAFEWDSGTRAPLADLHFSPHYGPGPVFVPDCLSQPDVPGSPGDCYTLDPEGFAPLGPRHAPPGAAVSSPFGPLTPSPSPTPLDSSQYDDWEHVEISILAQQISSLANSFDLYGTPGRAQNGGRPASEVPLAACDWPKISSLPAAAAAAQPFKHDLVLDDSVIDSLLKELDAEDPGEASVPCAGTGAVSQCSQVGQGEMALRHQGAPGVGPPTVADPLPMEQFAIGDASMDAFALRLGGHQQNPGLHQLTHYIHHGLQQDGILEEALY
ncbi:unnamed protein product [Lota lota]